ncbi:MAG: PAS domain S-box protein, partial [Chlorobi bacterium]|nr:PAS domain S-box protein [Chlorobiota bacterium]
MKEDKQRIAKSKNSFITYFKRWGVVFLISLAGILIVYEIGGSKWEFENRIEKLRKYYTQEQKEMIEHEVNRIVDIIDFESERMDEKIRVKIKSRVYEGYSIAEEIYNKFKGRKPDSEIQKLIVSALRPIRFDKGEGYYFLADLNGNVKLHGGRPDFEETNQLSSADKKSGKIVKNMIKIIRDKGEGFYEYFWEKPNKKGEYHKKITFLKLFKPYNWFLGTGVYAEETDSTIKKVISKPIEKHRFGPNNAGYVSILRLININGGKDFAIVYSNPNRHDLIGKHIADDYKDAKGKMFRKEMLKGLREKGECFVEYWSKKSDNPNPSPKVSFFKLAGDKQYIVTAGVYLDDVENDIIAMKDNLRKHVILKVLISILIVIIILLVFLILFNILARKLKNDFHLFDTFLKNVSRSKQFINVDEIKFTEIKSLATAVNNMLDDKIAAEQEVFNDREQLYVTLRSIGDGLITTDKAGKIILINSVAEKLTGWKNEEAQGKPLSAIFNIVNNESREPVNNPVQQVLEKGKIIGLANHTLLISKNGTEYQIADSASPIKNVDGEVIGVVLVFRNVTKEYTLQKELRKNQEMNEAILNAMPDLIFVVNKNFEFVSYIARTLRNLYSVPDEFIGKKIRDILPRDAAEKSIKSIEQVFQSGGVVSYEYSLELDGEVK